MTYQQYLNNAKAYLFDLDGTLLRIRPSGHEALLDFTADAGHRFELADQRKGLLWAHRYWADVDQIRHNRQHLSEEEFWRHYIRHYLLAMGHPPEDDDLFDQIARCFTQDFKPESQLAPGALDLLVFLRGRGYMVGLVSNRRNPLGEVAASLGIAEYLDFTLAAGEVDSWKPDGLIFQQALEMAGDISPQEAVYIGDNYYTDGLGAQRAGILPVLVDKLGIYTRMLKEENYLLIQSLTDLQAYIQNN